MAPIKFEENIKDKLEKRALKPSPDAWNKLSERLDTEPKRESNKTFWWLGIAASFVGLLIITSILFTKNSDNSIETQTIVNEEPKNPIKEKNDIVEGMAEEEKTKEIQITSEENIKDIIELKEPIVKPNKLLERNTPQNVVLAQENSTEKNETEVITFQEPIVASQIKEALTSEDKKVNDVVAQIQKLQKEKSSVTDAEIDALLHQAQEELMTEHLYNESTKTVDAELLLMQVESDLEQSFRDRVFEALKSSYKKVKVAVAERNN